MKLLIVDDEISAIEVVQKNIDFERLGINQVYTALNKQAAIDVILSHHIDILLCDIEMPMGSGLELLEWANENSKDINCIFMTCHADFSFAQKAISLGSTGYILKPLDFHVLEQTLEKVIEKRRNNRLLAQNNSNWEDNKRGAIRQFWIDVLVGDILPKRDNTSIYLKAKHLGISLDCLYKPMLISIKKWEVLNKEDEKLFAFALRNITEEINSREGLVGQILPFFQNAFLVIYYMESTDADSEQKLAQAVETIISMAEQYLKMTVCCYMGQTGDICLIPGQLESLQLMDLNNISYGKDRIWYLNDTDSFRKEQTDWKHIIERAKFYIEEHISDEITREDIAQHVFLNSDYLNRIFKRKENIALNQYVIQQKIEKAKWMLNHTTESIGEIAAHVGYYNYSSFNRIFSKATGMSPQEFKRNGSKMQPSNLL